jgi:hypothetical protein
VRTDWYRQRRSRLLKQRASSPMRRALARRINHLQTASRHAHHFFAAISFITSISRSRGKQLLETRILRLELLQALHVVRLHRAEALAPAVDRLLAHPCFFATAATGPRSASRKIVTICSSVNLPLRMPTSDS